MSGKNKMRFLCLPGAYGSADVSPSSADRRRYPPGADRVTQKFQVQLAPIVKELTSDNTASFHFIHGPCETVPPKGFEDYFGNPPYYRFIEPDDDGDSSEDEDILARIRDFPDCETPEDTMRELMKEGVASSSKSTGGALQYLLDIMEEQGPFEGIIGYSEGATVAATLLLHEQIQFHEKGIAPMFKYAIFFAGWPPVDPATHSIMLSDETERTIEIPTCHISRFCPRLAASRVPRADRACSRLHGSVPPRLAGAVQRLRPRLGVPLRPRQGPHAAAR